MGGTSHFSMVGCFAAILTLAGLAWSQSQALNGQIEGTVCDQNQAAVASAAITAFNVETGLGRSARTNEKGIYRFPLMPLGTYRITAEAANFKKASRDRVTLVTGQTATVDFLLLPGDVAESINVSSDAPLADAGVTDIARVMNNREVQNLPLVTRNPYNFALLQANVNGRPARGFAPPSINANGYARRVNFLLDGNANLQGDRTSIRFVLLSDTSVSEVQLLTNGFAAEFGNTPGLIVNMVTPSGTNSFHGGVSYRFRRPSFYSRPFFFPAPELPDSRVDNLTAVIGGPVIRDRWHFYFGYERNKRDDKAVAIRLLTIPPEAKAQLIAAGLPASIFPTAIPFLESGSFYIFRTDAELSDRHRLSVRFDAADLVSENGIQGGLNALERSIDVINTDHALATQLISYTSGVTNEFRFQYAKVNRTTGTSGRRNRNSGTGPSIVITGISNFGSPEGADPIVPPRTITQVQDNISFIRSTHVIKVGGGVAYSDNTDRSPIFARYTFRTVAAYLAARNGTDRRGYANYTEGFGDPQINYKATFWNFFVQDDWKVTRRLKLAFGLRYDLYQTPGADPASPFAASQKFRVDKNNFAPRIAAAYLLREGGHATVLRVGAGLYYDQPALAMYQRALQNNGTSRYFVLSFTPALSIAPDFPNTFSGSRPPGSVLPPPDIDAVSPGFENMYAIHSSIQIEQALAEDLSLTAGYVHSAGRHIPVYSNVNCVPRANHLADGRPLYGTINVNPQTGTVTILPCTERIYSQFRNIQMAESGGVSAYDALTLQLTKRYSAGLQFSANYTLSKATDDAPEQNLTTGIFQGLVVSDPSNRGRDKGRSFADQRHTFAMSLVAQPLFNATNRRLAYLLNNNQFAFIATANSGETFNILAGLDINADGISTSDRPVGIPRNSGTTPPQFNVDLRYSRFFDLTERYRLEVLTEFQNLFNINSIVGYNNVTVATDPLTGRVIGQLPDFRARNQSTAQESRQFQLGVRFLF
jgi:hypothetical protein